MTPSVVVRRLAALSGASAVVSGAYGAHGRYLRITVCSIWLVSKTNEFHVETSCHVMSEPRLRPKRQQLMVTLLITTAVLLFNIRHWYFL